MYIFVYIYIYTISMYRQDVQLAKQMFHQQRLAHNALGRGSEGNENELSICAAATNRLPLMHRMAERMLSTHVRPRYGLDEQGMKLY
jgi:hypothetical protein